MKQNYLPFLFCVWIIVFFHFPVAAKRNFVSMKTIEFCFATDKQEIAPESANYKESIKFHLEYFFFSKYSQLSLNGHSIMRKLH